MITEFTFNQQAQCTCASPMLAIKCGSDDQLWAKLYRTDFKMPLTSTRPSRPIVTTTASGVRFSCHWNWLYARRHATETNWRRGHAQVQTLRGHTGTVTCLSSDAHRVVSGSDDGSLVLWTLKRSADSADHGLQVPVQAVVCERCFVPW